jgi:IPT/TIG domain
MMCAVNKFRGTLVPLRHRLRVILPVVLALAGRAAGAPLPLTARVFVDYETAPPGGTVQLNFFLSQPSLITSGELAMDLDPTVFGSVTAVSAFSANGDAAGVAQIEGLHVDVRFASANGGIGRLAQVPLVVVTATVLPNATAGKTASVTADPSGSPWLDLLGNLYSVSVVAGTVTVGGTLSITSITPGGGVLPGGTAIAIEGTGFSSGATAEIDGASVATVQVTGAQTMSLILGGPTELTGKRISITNPDGSEVDAFAFIAAAPVSAPGTEADGVVPILPTETYTDAQVAGAAFIVIHNPSEAAVQVVVDKIDAVGEFDSEQPFTIPAGGSLLVPSPATDIRVGGAVVIASGPVQIVQLNQAGTQLAASAPLAIVVAPLEIDTATPGSSNSLSWVWQAGGAAPQTQTIEVFLPGTQPATDYAVSAMTSTGGQWLAVAPSGAIHCAVGVTPNPCANLQVSVNPSVLAPGIYRGTVTITPLSTFSRPLVEPAVIPVALTVTAAPPAGGGLPPALLAGPALVTAFASQAGATDVQPFGPNTICVTSAGVPLNFTAQASTSDGGGWISVANSSGTTPECVGFSFNSAQLGPGTYSGNIAFTSGAQSANVQVALVVAEPPGAPLLGAVVSADSTIPGALYPGEVVVIHGLNLGPAMGISGVNVLVGGIPASILYATPTLISAVVPDAVTGPSSVTVQVQNSSGSTAVWSVPLSPQPAGRTYHRLR